jgi:uncharacterized protein YndB with AHSA1/START domain
MKQEVKIRQQFKAKVSEVWKSITDKNEMKGWYFELEEFIPEVGFEFKFWGESETRKYLHLCRVTEVIEGSKICYTWEYDKIPGTTVVCFEIHPISGNTGELVLTHSGFETFPEEMNELVPANFEKGWKHIIGTSLKDYLDKKVQ